MPNTILNTVQETLPDRLPTRDSSTGRSFFTILQAAGGFIFGLALAIWAVPGVPEVIKDYIANNLLQVLLTVGIPTALSSGAFAYIMNYFRKGVKNY